MKVTINYRYFFLILLISVAGACKKSFLEITPKGKLVAETLLDYQRLLNNARYLADYAGGTNPDAQISLGDEIAAVEPYFQGVDFGFFNYDPLRMQRLFKWEDEVYQPEKNAYEMDPMQTIYLFNKVINEVPDLKDGTEQERKTLIAQAKACRAWAYLLLINYYGMPFNETTSATDPGFPIITQADVTETKFQRATVQEVYDFILNDLTTAIPDLPEYLSYRRIMSRSAAEGLLGKVYLFMGKFTEALAVLDAAINGSGTAEIPVGLNDYNLTFGAGGSFLPIGLFGPAYPAGDVNPEVLYQKEFNDFWAFTNSEFVINQQTISLFKNSDFRLNFYSNVPYSTSDTYPYGLLRRIGPFRPQFGVVLPDIYLMRAECKARINDLSGAKADVEILREKRMPQPDAAVPDEIAGDRKELIKFILEERIREFAVQGYRWFDMRRLSVDPEFSSTINYTHTLYNEDGSTVTFTLRPERFVLRFPRKVLDQNPGLENNP